MLIEEKKLKQILLDAGVIDEKTWSDVVKNAERLECPIEDILKSREIVSGKFYYELLARGLGVRYVNLQKYTIPEKVLDIFNGEIVNRIGAIPFELESGTLRQNLKVAFVKEWTPKIIKLMQKRARRKIKPYLTDEESFKSIMPYYKKESAEKIKDIIERKTTDHSDLEEVFSLLMEYIFYIRPSDIHIEELVDSGMIKLRVDGFLKDEFEFSKHLTGGIVGMIKRRSGTATDEDSQTDGGRFSTKVFGEELSFRVSIVPTYYGEKIVLRFLDDSKQKLSLSDLGFSDGDLGILKKEFEKPYGLILINGPTGSGKTTTLYSILKFLNIEGVSIATIEDPVEYPIRHINQSQVDEENGFTFSKGLKELLRQDPDIMVIGEIRDEETARIAVQSALTGHIVLSTIHSNTAPGTITRLLEMGTPNYLLSPTLDLAISQRLAKKICSYCVESYTPSKTFLKKLDKDMGLFKSLAKLKKMGLVHYNKYDDITFFKGKGCPKCGGKGYHGRIGLFEILNVNKDIQEMILNNKSESAIAKKAESGGMLTMFEDGVLKVTQGLTTIEAVVDIAR